MKPLSFQKTPTAPDKHPTKHHMDKTIKLRSFLFLALLALIGSTLQSHAQFPQGSYTNNFSTGGNTAPFAGSGSVASWIYWYNTPGGNSPITNDVTTPDPYGGPDAGSLEVYSPFYGYDTSTNHTQNLFFGTFDNEYGYDFSVTANLLNFSTVSFDVYVGTNNIPDSSGDFGTLNVGVITTGDSYEGFANGAVTIPGSASNGWVHLSVPVDKTVGSATAIPGIAIGYNNYGGYPTNNLTFWLGNLVMKYSGAPPPPPTEGLAKVVPGLTQFADELPNYNRQDLRTDQSGTANLSFFGKPGSVTYSWTIAAFPGTAHSNFLSGFTLTPDPVASQDYSDPDWSAGNAIWFAVQNNADGTVTAGLAYKTNQPAGNGQLFSSPGQLIAYNVETNGFTVPSAIGTWSLTFNQNTNITLTAPNGASTNVTFDPNVAALFNGYVGAYLYSSPQNNANIGQYCTYSAYKITGVGTPVNENLTSGALTAPFLELISQNYYYTGDYTTNPPDQIFATSNDAYWLYWTLPDAGFSPVASSTLQNADWNDISENIFENNGQHWLKVAKTDLPSPDSGFFALLQRQFTQLLVLLPGETNAPGTATGIIGTPTELSLSGSGGLEPVTVMAVDKNFYPVSGVLDTISLTSTDTGPVGGLSNGNVAMVNGVATFTGPTSYGFGDQGTWTITATDETSTNIAPDTSLPVVVGP
jgi:hypothetical protein